MMTVLELARHLIRFPSVTPHEAGSLEWIQLYLQKWGFQCTLLSFQTPAHPKVYNLYAEIGQGRPHFCFAGHIDVVPAGDETKWSVPPFAGILKDKTLYGRGAVDMKGAIACFIKAATDFLEEKPFHQGTLSLLLTSDEEGKAVDGTVRVIEWLQTQGKVFDGCIIGEPASTQEVGDTIKIGRRGSLNAILTVHGRQGHIAYPEEAVNPIPKLLEVLNVLQMQKWEEDLSVDSFFSPTHLEISSIDVENKVSNIIPASASARFNIRFTPSLTAAQLQADLEEICQKVIRGKHLSYELVCTSNAEAFLTPLSPFVRTIQKSIEKEKSKAPVLSTTGGTSDGRFIAPFCPIAEVGLCYQKAHQIDESVGVDELEMLFGLYKHILKDLYVYTQNE